MTVFTNSLVFNSTRRATAMQSTVSNQVYRVGSTVMPSTIVALGMTNEGLYRRRSRMFLCDFRGSVCGVEGFVAKHVSAYFKSTSYSCSSPFSPNTLGLDTPSANSTLIS